MPLFTKTTFLAKPGIILGALAFFLLPSFPALADCRPDAVSITISVKASKTTYNRSQSMAKLTNQHKNKRADLKRFNHTLGLTEAVFATRSSARTKIEKEGSGYCAVADNIEINIGWASRVSIASEITKDSCIWDTVYAHEQKHVKVNEKFMKGLSGEIEDAFRANLAGSTGRTAKEASKKAIELAKAITANAIQSFRARLDAAQAKIDTPEEYESIRRKCGDNALNALH